MAKYSAQMRRNVINRLTEVPNNNAKFFWSREMKITKELYEKFPDIGFWGQIKLPFKLKSLAWLKSKDGNKRLKSLWAVYQYKPEEPEQIELGKKVGKKYKPQNKKPQTILDFIS